MSLWRVALPIALLCMTASARADWRDSAQVRPHPAGIEFVDLGQQNTDPRTYKFKVADKYFWLHEKVLPPTSFTAHILKYSKVGRGETVLDLGTGCGVIAVFAADQAAKVIATDIDPAAVDNAQENIKRHGVDHIVEVRQGDLFAPVHGESFDVMYVTLPFPFRHEPESNLWTLHERFFREVGSFLQTNGRIYYQASEITFAPRIEQLAEINGLFVAGLHMEGPALYRQPLVYEFRKKR